MSAQKRWANVGVATKARNPTIGADTKIKSFFHIRTRASRDSLSRSLKSNGFRKQPDHLPAKPLTRKSLDTVPVKRTSKSVIKPRGIRIEAPDPTATKNTRLIHQLRLAVHEGGSSDPKSNIKLRRVIKQALDNSMTLSAIEATLRKCEKGNDSDLNTYLLQIRYQRKVFLICSVRTDSIPDLKRQLMGVLKKHGGGFVNAMNLFHNCGLIEAIVSYQSIGDFSNLENCLAVDAQACNCTGLQIIDYETGAVNFKCNPLELSEVCRSIKEKGYQVLHTDYGFRAKEFVELNWQEREAYEKFLRRLKKFPDIENIYDNVRYVDD